MAMLILDIQPTKGHISSHVIHQKWTTPEKQKQNSRLSRPFCIFRHIGFLDFVNSVKIEFLDLENLQKDILQDM